MIQPANLEHAENGENAPGVAARRRYEFRCWPLDPPLAVDILKRDWASIGHETRTDTYIVSLISKQCLAKIRGGKRLELKQLIGRVDILQLWELAYSQPFPIAPSVAEDFTSALCAAQNFEGNALLYASHLVHHLKNNPSIKLINVEKRRDLFESGTCRAEITHVQFADRQKFSIALEDENQESANSAVSALGLGALPNRSYGDVLIDLFL